MDHLEEFVRSAVTGVSQRMAKFRCLYDPVLRRRGHAKTDEVNDSVINLEPFCYGNVIHPSLSNVSVNLQARDLWERFHSYGTEMIVTKIGRGMFPRLKIYISGLDPELEYSVAVDFLPVDNKRYRYTFPTSRWTVTGHGDIHLPARWHVHPSSPSKGIFWMSEVISFDRLKITNNNCDQNGYIILNSMHKYQPRVHVIQSNRAKSEVEGVQPSAQCRFYRTFVFEETQFIAVTAYQNPRVTQIKVAENPFARGFRKCDDDNGDETCADSSMNGGSGSPPFNPGRTLEVDSAKRMHHASLLAALNSAPSTLSYSSVSASPTGDPWAPALRLTGSPNESCSMSGLQGGHSAFIRSQSSMTNEGPSAPKADYCFGSWEQQHFEPWQPMKSGCCDTTSHQFYHHHHLQPYAQEDRGDTSSGPGDYRTAFAGAGTNYNESCTAGGIGSDYWSQGQIIAGFY